MKRGASKLGTPLLKFVVMALKPCLFQFLTSDIVCLSILEDD